MPERNSTGTPEEPLVCPRCHGVSPFAEGVSELRKRCTPLTCDAWTFTHRLTKEGPKPIRKDGRADLKVAS